ncbi:LamG-like jellyroll fold domain-containing protein [Aeromicrobium sp.]|uniref:LamG-like jellyroll fold domain-containing protein n=1 Tax=Aeromicrobium sp. TaxID=1871063 RepID=UPI0019C4DB4A|nr:LamG-like jellyroll fold domain-containing protein [Aeromicrobium sp.]MBC7632265.1 DNRLRE domain-containing protein [Aeromicrobium sp.]
MRTRFAAIKAIVVAAATGLAVLALPASPASALSPGVAFSADNLPTWQTNGVVYAVGESGGKVVAGGTFSQIRPPDGTSGTAQTRNALAVFNAQTGAPDSCQFTFALSGGTPTVRSVVTSDDGKTVYVGGNFSSINGTTVLRAAAIDLAACTVKAFRPTSISSYVYGMAIHGNTLYLAGAFQTIAGQPRQRFAAVNATTGALLPFVADADATGRAVAVSPDGGKVAIGGDFFNVNGAYSHSIAVVDSSSGSNLKTYGPGFIADTSVTKTIFSGDDGKFYVGNEGTGGGVFDGRLAVSWSTLDQVWRDTCLGATQAVLESNGTLYSASHAHDCNGNPVGGFQDGKRNYFNAQSAETAELYGWDPKANDGTGEGIGPRALVIAKGSNGKSYLWSGGEFTRINGAAQQGLTRFSSDDTGTVPTPVSVSEAMSDGTVQVRFRSVVDTDDSYLTYRVYRNGSATPIWEGKSNSLWWKRPQVTFVDKTVSAGTRYTYRVSATDGTNPSALSAASAATAVAPTADYASTVRGDLPSLYWPSSSSGTWVQDTSATSSNGTGMSGAAMGGATTSAAGAVTGDTTGSLSFDGADDYVWNDNLADGPNVYTVEAWINTTTTNGGKIIGYGNGRPFTGTNDLRTSSNYDRQIYMENDGRVRFGVYNGGTSTIRSAASLNDGGWHHVVGTQGASGMAFYVDGKKIGTNPTTFGQSYKGVWHVGGDNLSGWPDQPSSNFFAGRIDEVAIYPTVLAQKSVAKHYLAGGGQLSTNASPTDAYGKAIYDEDPTLFWRLGESSGSVAGDASYAGTNPGEYNSGVTKGETGVVQGNQAIRTPGNDSGTVATASSQVPTGAFSTEVWLNTTTTSGGKIVGFENSKTGNGNSYDKHIYMSDSGQVNFGTYVGYTSAVTSTQSYNDGKWHQAVGVLGSGGTTLYIDGVQVGHNDTTGAESGEGYWRLGGGSIGGWPGSPSSYYFDGKIDEFSVYDRALPASAIAQHYGLGVADTQAPTTPADVTATAAGSTVSLAWTASTDNNAVTGYRVYRGTSADFTPAEVNLVDEPTTTSSSLTLSPIGTTYYKVVAVDGAGNRSPASAASSVTVLDTDPPTTPGNVTATLQSADTVKVGWAASTDNQGVTSYGIYRGTDADFSPTAANKVGEVANTYIIESNVPPGTYYYKVVAFDAAGNVSGLSSGATVIVPAPPAPDTTAPTAPSGVTAVTTGSTIKVQWNASVDAVGVTGYSVYRGTSAGFTVSSGSKIADVTALEYSNTSLSAGTYYYKVTAMDAAGNVSSASNGASAAIAAPPVDPVTVTVPTKIDAMVYRVNPTTNYGSDSQLSSRGAGGNSPIESFLAFDLPAAPAGMVLGSATIKVRTSTDPTSGSVDKQTFDLVTGSWTETGVTWNTRPTTVIAKVGEVVDATATNTAYSGAGDVSILNNVLGQSATLRISSAGTDNSRLWSLNAPTVSYRPTLSLTFVAAP